jgi:hypothetical protein
MAFVFDEFFPFDPGFGASANATRWRKMAQLWQADGVLSQVTTQMHATMAGNTVTVQPGAVFMHGYYAELGVPRSFTVGTSGTIVAQANLATDNEFVQLVYRDAVVDYGTNPNTAYQQDGSVWEIPLWLIQSGGLIDVRTFLNPGGSLTWFGSSPSAVNVTSGATVNVDLLTARVPYVGMATLRGTAVITLTDFSQAQSAACALVFQNGTAEQVVGPASTPQVTAGGPNIQVSFPVSASAWVGTGQGRKKAGWRVVAGSGPQVQVREMTLTMTLAGMPPN